MTYPRSRVTPSLEIDWDVPIEMDDGLRLRADVYRPRGGGRYPVILSYGPYGKWLHFSDGSPRQWERLTGEHPETRQGTTGAYACYEVVDPERWVPDGYACVRVDSRGAGRSPGFLDPWSPRETEDLYRCIEWAGRAEWSNGRVGLSGISYYAINQWQVAALQPPHLAAMCIWEGSSDLYRELAYHGDIHCTFADLWYRRRVVDLQHGLGRRGPTSRMTGDAVTGPVTLPDETLGMNRTDYGRDLLKRPLIDEYWEARVPDLSRIRVPLLSAGNLGGTGLHLRGNVEGFLQAGSEQKWLELHGLEHWTHFYTDYGLDLQKRFFGHFLQGRDTGWESQPPVQVQVRGADGGFSPRAEQEWPLARTVWTSWYLWPRDLALAESAPDDQQASSFEPAGDGMTFVSVPFVEDTEVTGPLACKLFISTDGEDADLFITVRVFTPDMAEVTFQGANEPNVPVAQGWLRASHRALDKDRSMPYRPHHTHERAEPVTPGEVYELDVEIWPTSIVVPAGHRIALSVAGRDYSNPAREAALARRPRGVGPFPFRHDAARDRRASLAAQEVRIHAGPEQPSHLLVPLIPPR